MSFSRDIKNELCRKENTSQKKKSISFIYGLIIFSTVFSSEQILFQTEIFDVAVLYKKILKKYFKISIDIGQKGKSKKIYSINIKDKNYINNIINKFNTKKDNIIRLNQDIISKDNFADFLRGAYISCGSSSDPKKEYHLEFAVKNEILAEDLYRSLLEKNIPVRISIRKNKYSVVYLKESSSIEDLLTLIGATQASLKIMDIKIYKEIRNNVNRVNNFETANIAKTATAAADQIYDIEYILNKKGEKFLSADLMAVANIRLNNPHMSLKEIEEIIQPKMTRSSINRRLVKIRSIAKNLREEE